MPVPRLTSDIVVDLVGEVMIDAVLTTQDLRAARKRIAPFVTRSPLIRSPQLTEIFGAAVHLKLENLQETGSFKIRGAANKLLSLVASEKVRGVVTFSTGNHGLAVSYVAGRLGIRAVICVSSRVQSHRIDAIKSFGAEVVVCGDDQDEAMDRAFALQASRGPTMISAFDDPWVIAGQGTIGLELLEDLTDIDMVLIPVSGGGLISGIALALKSANPAIRTVGVSMERGAAMHESIRAGRPIQVPEQDTIADCLAGGIGLENKYTFAMVQEFVDDFVLVSENEIAAAMAFCLNKHHVVTEGAGAVGIAALLHHKRTNVGNNVAVIISGGNVDLPLLWKIAGNSSPVFNQPTS